MAMSGMSMSGSGMSMGMSMDMASMTSAASSSMSTNMASMSMDMASMSSAMSSMSQSMAASSMASMPMSMSMSMPSATSASAAATSTGMGGMSGMSGMGGMDMGGSGGNSSMSGMDMDMGGDGCKMTMLWNWNTIDACFISSDWHIKTSGHFAGTCISVAAWAVLLQAMLRLLRELDRYLVKSLATSPSYGPKSLVSEADADSIDKTPTATGFQSPEGLNIVPKRRSPAPLFFSSRTMTGQIIQLPWWWQLVRTVLHAIQWGASYLFMLMAMYYNGYVLISMFLGYLIGHFFFTYDTLGGSPHTAH